MKTKSKRESGLSILEVCLVVAALALVAILFLPTLSDKPRPERWRCIHNLKQAGLGFLVWAHDGDGVFPWASTNVGGTIAFAESPQVFRHFLAASNEMVTPKILVCPTDKKRKEAWEFSNFSNANLSYFVGLDANTGTPPLLLNGDRNITGGTLSNGFLRLLNPASGDAGWTTELHEIGGTIGLSDGSVSPMTAQQLQQQLGTNTLSLIRLAAP